MHAPPPVFSGAASAPGLKAIAAPHIPTPATTLMLNRPKVVIDVNSLSRPGMGLQIITVQSHRAALLAANSFLMDQCSTRTTPHPTVSK
jgi:hypothetical protein